MVGSDEKNQRQISCKRVPHLFCLLPFSIPTCHATTTEPSFRPSRYKPFMSHRTALNLIQEGLRLQSHSLLLLPLLHQPRLHGQRQNLKPQGQLHLLLLSPGPLLGLLRPRQKWPRHVRPILKRNQDRLLRLRQNKRVNL